VLREQRQDFLVYQRFLRGIEQQRDGAQADILEDVEGRVVSWTMDP